MAFWGIVRCMPKICQMLLLDVIIGQVVSSHRHITVFWFDLTFTGIIYSLFILLTFLIFVPVYILMVMMSMSCRPTLGMSVLLAHSFGSASLSYHLHRCMLTPLVSLHIQSVLIIVLFTSLYNIKINFMFSVYFAYCTPFKRDYSCSIRDFLNTCTVCVWHSENNLLCMHVQCTGCTYLTWMWNIHVPMPLGLIIK